MHLVTDADGTEISSLYRMIYCSTMDFDREDLPFTKEIHSILEWSRNYNPTVGITGALMVGQGRFAQVLEGPKGAVKTLYGNIACDQRHRRVLLLNAAPIEERSFSDWSMAYASRTAHDAIPLSSRPRGSDLGHASVTAGGVLSMLIHIVQNDRSAQDGSVRM